MFETCLRISLAVDGQPHSTNEKNAKSLLAHKELKLWGSNWELPSNLRKGSPHGSNGWPWPGLDGLCPNNLGQFSASKKSEKCDLLVSDARPLQNIARHGTLWPSGAALSELAKSWTTCFRCLSCLLCPWRRALHLPPRLARRLRPLPRTAPSSCGPHSRPSCRSRPEP